MRVIHLHLEFDLSGKTKFVVYVFINILNAQLLTQQIFRIERIATAYV